MKYASAVDHVMWLIRCNIYIDDLLIYTATEDEHERILKQVLKRLKDNNLAVASENCKWHKSEVEFLGYMISENGISMSLDKVQTILDWETAKNVKDVQAFLGFANFYRRFIAGFSRIC